MKANHRGQNSVNPIAVCTTSRCATIKSLASNHTFRQPDAPKFRIRTQTPTENRDVPKIMAVHQRTWPARAWGAKLARAFTATANALVPMAMWGLAWFADWAY